MDAALLVADYLNASDIGAAAYLAVPSSRPDEFLVVEQTGGGRPDRVRLLPSVDVDCWAKTRARASELSDEVAAAALAMADELPNVFRATVTTQYNNPDPDSGQPRYTVGIDITANE